MLTLLLVASALAGGEGEALRPVPSRNGTYSLPGACLVVHTSDDAQYSVENYSAFATIRCGSTFEIYFDSSPGRVPRYCNPPGPPGTFALSAYDRTVACVTTREELSHEWLTESITSPQSSPRSLVVNLDGDRLRATVRTAQEVLWLFEIAARYYSKTPGKTKGWIEVPPPCAPAAQQ